MNRSLILGVWAALWCLAAAAPRAEGQTSLSSRRTPHPAVVRVVVPERNGASYGSGTLVDVHSARGLVLTNWHVVSDAVGPVTAIFPDGFRSEGRIVKTDKDWDLAAVSIRRPAVTPVSLAAAAPRPGERLTIAGYGPGPYREAVGLCTQYLAPGRHFPLELVELSTEARQGDSGGPIFNNRGELAGVLFGAGNDSTAGSYCGRVSQFLASVMPKTPDPGLPEGTSAIARAEPRSSPLRMPFTNPAADRNPFSTAEMSPLTKVQGRSTPAHAVGLKTGFDQTESLRAEARPGGFSDGSTGSVASSPTRDPSRRSAVESASSGPEPLRWQDLAGESLWEQIKSVLAILGGMTILFRGVRLFGSPEPAKNEKS